MFSRTNRRQRCDHGLLPGYRCHWIALARGRGCEAEDENEYEEQLKCRVRCRCCVALRARDSPQSLSAFPFWSIRQHGSTRPDAPARGRACRWFPALARTGQSAARTVSVPAIASTLACLRPLLRCTFPRAECLRPPDVQRKTPFDFTNRVSDWEAFASAALAPPPRGDVSRDRALACPLLTQIPFGPQAPRWHITRHLSTQFVSSHQHTCRSAVAQRGSV